MVDLKNDAVFLRLHVLRNKFNWFNPKSLKAENRSKATSNVVSLDHWKSIGNKYPQNHWTAKIICHFFKYIRNIETAGLGVSRKKKNNVTHIFFHQQKLPSPLCRGKSTSVLNLQCSVSLSYHSSESSSCRLLLHLIWFSLQTLVHWKVKTGKLPQPTW